MDSYFFDLHSDIVARQGKICKKCKRSLILADKVSVVDGAMYCGSCGSLQSKKAEVKRKVFGTETRADALLKARREYYRVRNEK